MYDSLRPPSRVGLMIACLATLMASGCASTVPQHTASASRTTDAPIVWSSTVGGCTEPVHRPFPDYGTEVPFTGEPTPTQRVAPEYPPALHAAPAQGTVKVAALVCEHGKVVATKVIESIPELDVAATNAVRQWVFDPANIRGDRVAAWIVIPVKFSTH